MIKKYILFSLSIILLSWPVRGEEQKIAVGLIFIEPTGINAKYWINEGMALNGAVGWVPGKRDSGRLHGDILFGHVGLFDNEKAKASFYAGIGGRLSFAKPAKLYLRVPFGLDFFSQKVPLNLFIEAAPVIGFSPEVSLRFRGAMGVRYIFR
jgi:hypothetical protein